MVIARAERSIITLADPGGASADGVFFQARFPACLPCFGAEFWSTLPHQVEQTKGHPWMSVSLSAEDAGAEVEPLVPLLRSREMS